MEKGVFKLCTESSVKSKNTKVTKSVTSTTYYKKKTLSDVKLLLFHKLKSSTKRTIKSSEASYYKKVADKQVGKKDSKYTKAKKLFKYVATTYYYDDKHKGGTVQTASYDDPYYNVKYAYTKTGNKYNAYNGKVALRCDGYAGIYCALVRSQGIPCRLVTGKHVEPDAGVNWTNSGGAHTWCEIYVDSKWRVVDPCLGGIYNKYTKKGEFEKSAYVNWEYFDMTPDNYALTHKAEQLRGERAIGTLKVAKPTVKKYSKKYVTVKWKKQSKAQYYQIRYKSTKKNAKWKIIKTVGNVSSAKVSNLRGYYSVRGYGFKNSKVKMDSGARYNGTWSTARKY